jgi:hypothetical protein
MQPELVIVDRDGNPIEPAPGPIWLESYEYGERMYVPGEVRHIGFYNGMPHIAHRRLEGPGVMHLGDTYR